MADSTQDLETAVAQAKAELDKINKEHAAQSTYAQKIQACNERLKGLEAETEAAKERVARAKAWKDKVATVDDSSEQKSKDTIKSFEERIAEAQKQLELERDNLQSIQTILAEANATESAENAWESAKAQANLQEKTAELTKAQVELEKAQAKKELDLVIAAP